MNDGSVSDGVEVRDVFPFPGSDVEPGGFDDVGSVVPLVGKFGDV